MVEDAIKPVLKYKKGDQGSLGPTDLKEMLRDKLNVAGGIIGLTNACLGHRKCCDVCMDRILNCREK